MSAAPDPRIVEKLRKLLALTKSDNLNEASVAAGVAARLAAQHDIELAELEAAEPNAPREPIEKDVDPVYTCGRRIRWKSRLLGGLATAHHCLFHYRDTIGGLAACLAGRPSDVATIRYLFAWISTELERLVRKSGYTGAARTDWLLGAARGVLDRMTAERAAVHQTATSTALVRVEERGAELDAAKRQLFPDWFKSDGKERSGRSYSARPVSASAYEAGQRAGRNLHTGAALGASSARALPAKAGGS